MVFHRRKLRVWVFLITLLSPLFMEVLWTFSDRLSTFCFIWVAKKWILMPEFSHTTAVQRSVTSCIWEMIAFSYSFTKCIGLFCHHFSMTSSSLIFSFLLVLLSFFTFTVLFPSCWISVSINFPSDTLTCFFFYIESHFVTSCL